MIIKQSYRDANNQLRTRVLAPSECRCDIPDWCGCGRCHRCGGWLRRIYDPRLCESVSSSGAVIGKVTKQQSGKKTLATIDRLLRMYIDEVNKTDLTSSSKLIYIDKADCFVRWIRGKFMPGSRGVWKRPKKTS